MHQYSSRSFSKFPVSAIQHQFWLIYQLQPDSSAYNIPSLFRIKGRLNYDALVKAINEIINRHSVFRTTFASENKKLLQIVAPEFKITPQIIDLAELTGEQQNEAQQIIDKEVARPFDLAKGPLLRITLLRLAEEEHVLLILMHHIITDLKTKDLFSAELSKHYNTFAAGHPSHLAAPAHQYLDYALWHQQWLMGDECEKMISYWEKRLKERNGYLNLPTDHPRPAIQKLSGAAQPIFFSQKFTKELKNFSRQRNVNIFLTLLASYLTLLYRYSNQGDITVGVPLTNRRQDAHKEIFGCFVNIMPLSFDISGDSSFDEVLRQVRIEMLAAHRNQEVPFEEIVRRLQSKRDVSYNPLFQAGFTFEPPMELELQGLAVESQKIHNQGAQLDIFVTLWEKAGEVHGFIEYNTDLFERATIARFVGHYETLLRSIVVSSNQSISSFPILSETERQQFLIEWNATEKALPEKPVLQKLFEKQVEKSPDAVAVVFENKGLTYRELNERANQLAHHLRSLGVGPEVLVGVFMERSLEMIIALYGILKAGGAYVPFDPEFPQERLAFMIEDTELKILLTQKSLDSQLPDYDSQKIFLDTDWPKIANEPISNPSTKISPENLAYVIFTSGSTGRPKGVQVPHRAAVNFLLSMLQEPGITDQDVLMAVTTLSFDISVLELFLPLITGAKTIIASRETASNGEQLLDLLINSRATVMQATPTTWYLLLAAGWEASKNFKVLCGGEPLPHGLARKLLKCSSSVWNLYGPTETTVWSTCYQILSEEDPILIGKPIANTQIYIVNQENQLNPVGVAGEMLIGGTGVTRGYLKRPDLTKKNFIPDLFSNEPDRLLYRTGDMASFLPDGNIKIFGRLDHQVKLRGYRIELSEIETTLATYSSIDKAVVLVREDAPGDKRLVAYVTLKSGHDYSPNEFRRHLRISLPDYMIPSIFIRLAEMPLTLNGKIDRRALPQPEQKRSDLDQKFIPPQNETEVLLSEIWGEILKIDRVGIHDNFFDLGGNSLLSVQLVDLMNQKVKIDIPVVKFFQYPTISTLAEYINNKHTSQQTPDSLQNRVKLQREALAQQKRLFRKRKS